MQSDDLAGLPEAILPLPIIQGGIQVAKQLRYRILITMTLLLSITFIGILVVINIWTRANDRMEADTNLRLLMQREVKPDAPKNNSDSDSPADHSIDSDTNSQKNDPDNNRNTPPPGSDKAPPGNSDKMPPDNSDKPEPDMERHREIAISHYILAKYSSSKEMISIENTLSDSLSEEELAQYCETLLSGAQTKGTIHHLRYTIRKNSDETVIAFIDYTAAEESEKNLFMISIILGAAGLAAFTLLSYVLSGLMVRPVDEAFEKQKQFISDASHELKTPITVILSNSELLEDQIGENKQLTYIKKECDQMHHLVTSLLTLTRLEQAPYTDVEKHTFLLSDALLERILPFESIAFEKGITLQEDILPELSFYGVKEQLQQVATILIDNALSHTPKGGTIDVTLQKTQHHIVFTVSNTGEPIPDDEKEKLFERFYRVDKARNRTSGHYGLGLSIAKTILNNHKGHIRVECNDGITSFIVTLRLAEKQK